MAEQNMTGRRKVVRYYYEVNGTGALKPEILPEIKPKRKKRTKVRHKPKRAVYRDNDLESIRVRAAEAVSPLGILGLAIALVMAVLVLQAQIELNSLNNQVVSLRSELSELQSTQDELTGQYEQLFDMQSIESDMLNSGKMIVTDSTQQIYLDMSEADTVTVYESQGWLAQLAEGLVETLTEFFG